MELTRRRTYSRASFDFVLHADLNLRWKFVPVRLLEMPWISASAVIFAYTEKSMI